MKVQKYTEMRLTTKNFSDMENWSDKQTIVHTGTKTLDIELGRKVLELLDEYGLGIMGVGPGDWIKGQHLLFSDETNLKEYRVSIGKKMSWEDFIDNNYVDNYDDASEEEQAEMEEEFKKLEIDSDPCIEFSVFLPEKISEIEAAAMSDASTYLKMLNDSDLEIVMNGSAGTNMLFDDVFGVKKFLILKKIKITNDNLEDLPNISYRLYKDSKAFSMFEELLDDREFENFFKEWLELL
jgi:hypothetical protein